MSLADHLKPIVDGSARILIVDVERLPGTAWLWDKKPKYVPPNHWITKPRMICWAARWYGQKTMQFKAEWQPGGTEAMLETAWNLYDKADFVCGYYSTGADNPWFRQEWGKAGMGSPSPWKDVDLYRTVRQQFNFTFNSLDEATTELGRPVGKETHYSIEMAAAAVSGNREAARNLRVYNEADVELAEWLYDRLRPWLKNHPHLGEWGDEVRCNRCGSDELTLLPNRYRAVLIDYALYRCDACGGHVRGAWHARQASTRGV